MIQTKIRFTLNLQIAFGSQQYKEFGSQECKETKSKKEFNLNLTSLIIE